MSLIDKIYDDLQDTTNTSNINTVGAVGSSPDTTPVDFTSALKSAAESNPSEEPPAEEPYDFLMDGTCINSLNKYIDQIRNSMAAVLDVAGVTYEIAPYSNHKAIYDCINHIMDTMMNCYAKLEYINSYTLSLNKLYVADVDFEYTFKLKTNVGIEYVQAEDCPLINMYTENFEPIVDDEYSKYVKRFNNIINTLNEDEYLKFINKPGLGVLKPFKQLDAVSKMSDTMLHDYNYSDVIKNTYYDVFQIPSQYIRYSREYPLQKLSKLLVGCNQIINVSDQDLAQIAESDVLKQLSKIKRNLDSFELDEFPDSIKDLYSDLSQASILDHINSLNNVRGLVHVLTSMSSQIKYLNTALGVLFIKFGNAITPETFHQQFIAVKDLIYSFDLPDVQNKSEQILSQIDDDLLHVKPQMGIKMINLDPNSVGLDPEFIKAMQLFLDIQKIYHTAVDKLNNVSTESGLAAYFYPTLKAYQNLIVPKAKDLSKVIKDLKLNNAKSAVDTSRFDKIIQDPILNQMLDSVRANLKQLLLTVNTKEFESDLIIVDHFFNIIKELIDQLSSVNKEFPIDTLNLKAVRLNMLILDTMNVLTSKFKTFMSKIGIIGNQYNNLVSDNIKIMTTLQSDYVNFVGLNNISQCEYTDFNSNLLLFGVLHEYEAFDFSNLILPTTRITSKYKAQLISDLDLFIKNKYSTLALDLTDENIQLKPLQQLTVDYLSEIAPEIKDSDLKQEVFNFIGYLTLKSTINRMSVYNPDDYNIDKFNIVIDSFNVIKSELEHIDEDTYRQAIYLAEEFKPELSNFVKAIPKDLPFSFDINTRYLQTIGYLSFDGTPYLEMLDYYEKMTKRGLDLLNKVEHKTGNMTDFLFTLAKSDHIELTENSVKIVFDTEDFTKIKVILLAFKALEPKYIGVKNTLLFIKKHNSELIRELDQFKEVIQTTNKKGAKDILKVELKYLDYYDQDDIDERTSPLTIFPSIYNKNLMAQLIGNTLVYKFAYDENDDNVLDSEEYKTYIKESLYEGWPEFWEINRVTTHLNIIKNNINDVQQKMSLKFNTAGFKMRTQIKSHVEKSPAMKIYKKICPETKAENEVYSNIVSTKGYNPLLPLKRVMNDDIKTGYLGDVAVYDPIKAHAVNFPTVTQISDEYSIYQTDYLITTADNRIVPMVKVFKNLAHVFGITDVKIVGYGYIDYEDLTVKFSPTLPIPMKLVDTTKPLSEYTVTANQLGYGNNAHIFKMSNEYFAVCNYGYVASTGFIGQTSRLMAVRSHENLGKLDLNETIITSPDALMKLTKYKSKVKENDMLGGVNNECSETFYFEAATSAGQFTKNLIIRDAIYNYDPIKNQIIQSPISMLYGMFVDTQNGFNVKLATGVNVLAYRIRSAFGPMPDYFLAVYDDYIKKYRIISPQMLDKSESLRQQLYDNLDQQYALYDYNALVLQQMLGIDYLPTPAIANINGFSNLYTTIETIYVKGQPYNKVVDLHQDYVGFTDGYRVVFDQKLKPSNTVKIYSSKIKTILITSSNIK